MEFLIYLLGVILLSAAYPQLKSALGSGVLFVSFVIAYLLVLRFIGYGFRRYVATRRNDSEEG